MAKDGTKKGKKTGGKKGKAKSAVSGKDSERTKTSSSSSSSSRISQKGKDSTPVATTPRQLEHAWGTYAASLVQWTECMVSAQESHAKAALAWVETWRRALEFDTEVLRATMAYYEECWRGAQEDSARQHSEAAAACAGMICGAQSDLLGEFNRQWDGTRDA